MKWVFLLSLLVLGGVGGLMGGVVVYRWNTSMQEDVKVVPGNLPLRVPPGTVPRTGGELAVPREAYVARKNPVPEAERAQSAARGRVLFQIYCTPCHGPEGKGDGLVTPRFIPPPDLASPVIQGRTDGHLAHYIGYGGPIMPAYGEALSVAERWDLVNYLRSLARR